MSFYARIYAVHCPRCRVPISGDRCPQCGLKITPFPEKSEREAPSSESKQEPISFSFETPQAASVKPAASDWRLELKRKLSERGGKRETKETTRSTASEAPAAQIPDQTEAKEIERPLFQYALSEQERPEAEPKVVTFAKKPAMPRPAEKPVIRMPVTSRPQRRRPAPEQQELRLEPNPATVPERTAESIEISREILFSRMLAGMIDLLLPALTGVLFAFVGSWILRFDFFSPRSFQLTLVFSLAFYFLNSFFFLLTSGQTPGMYLTDLQLMDEESDELPFGSVFLRVCLFLPVAATIIGLVWAFFDPWRRCLHDRLSQTRVIPKN